jgi:putative addiction module component (TIGR02574 family)
MPDLTQEEIARLSPTERLTLIARLWNSLGSANVPLADDQRAELLRRLDSFDQDRVDALAWEQLKARLARRAP